MLIVFDYYLERGFPDAVQTVGLDLACRARGGFLSDQQNGKFVCSSSVSNQELRLVLIVLPTE